MPNETDIERQIREVRECLLGQVEIRSIKAPYGHDADGNRGVVVTEPELLTKWVYFEDVREVDVLPTWVIGPVRDNTNVGAWLVRCRIQAVGPNGHACYRVSMEPYG